MIVNYPNLLPKRIQCLAYVDDSEGAHSFHFAVRRLETASALNKKLSSVVEKALDTAKRLERYSFEGAVEKDTALFEELSETALTEILKSIGDASARDVVSDVKHLHSAYGYVIQLEPKDKPPLFAFRRVQSSWKARRVLGLINTLLLKNNVLVTADEEKIFRFDRKVDFFSCDGVVFILDKVGFESALNFRIGMERKRDELVEELKKSGLYRNLELVTTLSTSHVRWLKKLAGARRLGKCTDAAWVEKLLNCCQARSLPVRMVNGQIEITAANCELIVRLMNYDLLESPVDQSMFKIDGAKEAY